MRNRVMITNTKFIVDSVNKVIVCELRCNLQLDKHPAWRALDIAMWVKRFPYIDYKGDFTVKAKVRCNNIDTFDERKGKMIAESRAKVKMFSIASRLWKDCSDAINTMAIQCSATSKSCLDAEIIERNHVRELTI